MVKEHYYQGEPMDLLHTVAFEEMYPIVSCLIQLSLPINVDRLQWAVDRVGRQLPEIFCHYQPVKNRWRAAKVPHTVIVQLEESQDPLSQPVDFLKDAQLKIFIKSAPEPIVYMVMSHIFTDGSGFKEFLYLLADSYNQQETAGIHNERSSESLVNALLSHGSKYKSKMSLPDRALTIPFTDEQVSKKFIDYVDIPEEQFIKIRQKAKTDHLTINDVIMAAYIIQLSKKTNLREIPLPCPTDLRQFLPGRSLRIANLTGEYSLLISVDRKDDVSVIARKIHHQIADLRKQKAFLQAAPMLQFLYRKLPVFFLRRLISRHYHVQTVSYTNFGILDQRFHFEDNTILHCLLTGSFRSIPQFQVAVATYAQKCTLSFCMIGSLLSKAEGHDLISGIATLLEKWSC
ncbi:hypothetical protein [Sporolactobacillus sp. KGMB 08714]|uniref:hypothetical protein n=1 Tax=Sporolactobacillus sp. KGMB 08714 TaxID=3064704 RepID=UPI002FBDA66C